MKNTPWMLLCAILIGLFGCSAEGTLGPSVSDYYSGLETYFAQTNVTAHYSDYSVDFVLDFRYDAHKGSTVTVAGPEEIAGVEAHFADSSMTASFEGAAIEFGDPSEILLSPMAILPELFRVWSDGVVIEQGFDRLDRMETIFLTHQAGTGEGELLLKTWFDRNTYQPIQSEIYQDQQLKMQCTFLIVR